MAARPTCLIGALMIWLALATLPVAGTEGPQPSAVATGCSLDEARGFDFWIGDWEIEQRILDAGGGWITLPARTSVSRALGGCALVEHWEGTVQFFWEGMDAPEPMKGLSIRAYDPEEGVWRIHWMDSRHPRFQSPYVGRFGGGRGEFVREWTGPDGDRLGRITFEQPAPDRVVWTLAVSRDDGESWTTLWTMEMSRASR